MRLPDHLGTVTKLPGNRHKPWWARGPQEIGPDGKKHRPSLGTFKRKGDAIDALKARDASLNHTKATLKRMYEMYKEERIRKEALEESTLKGYDDSFKHCRTIENKVFTTITLDDLEEIFENMYRLNSDKKIPLSYNSKKKVKAVLINIFDYAMRKDYIRKNYAEDIELKSNEEKMEKDVFSEIQIHQMFKKVDEIKDLDIVLILIHTGLRPTELLNLTKENIDLERRVIFNFGIKTNAGKRRIMPISDKIFPFIEKRYNNTEDYLFKSNYGKKMSAATYRRNKFDKAMQELGYTDLNITPYSTRHTFATLMNQRNIRGPVQAELMGHEKESTTQKHYNHENIDELRKAVNAI